MFNKKKAVFWMRSFMGRNLIGFHLLSWFTLSKKRRKLLISSLSDICIEGYPRCANTFAVLAFRSVQKEAVLIAHHMHLAGQVLYAIKNDIPAIVLIRDPLDACVSMLLREPKIGAQLCLAMYVDFYKPLLPYADRFVVAEFDRVTTDYGSLIEQVNKMYSTNFERYINSPERDQTVFDELARLPLEESPLSIARPTAEKQGRKKDIIALFECESCSVLMEECSRIYSELVEYA